MTPEIDKSNEYSEKSSPENLVCRNVHDKLLSQKSNNELFLRTHIYPKLSVIDESGSKVNVIADSNQACSIQDYHSELAERYAEGKLSYVRFKELWKSEAPFIVPDDSNSEYSEKSSPEKIVEGFMHGKISMERYNELYRKAYINMIHRSSPTPLKRLEDSIDYKKNQIINKVVGFVKRLGIFEK